MKQGRSSTEKAQGCRLVSGQVGLGDFWNQSLEPEIVLPYTYTHRPLQLRVCVWFNAYQHAVSQIALKTAFGIIGALAGLVLTTNKVTSFSALSSHIVLSCLELIETSSSSNSPTSDF